MNAYDTPPPTIVPILHPRRIGRVFIGLTLLLFAAAAAYFLYTRGRDAPPEPDPGDSWMYFVSKGGWQFTFEYCMDEVVKTAAGRQTEGMADEVALARIANAVENAETNFVRVIGRRLKTLGYETHATTPDPGGATRVTVRIPGAPEERGGEIAAALTNLSFLSFHIVHPESDEMSKNLLYTDVAPPGYKTEVIKGNVYYIPENRDAPPPPAPELYGFGDPPEGFVFRAHDVVAGHEPPALPDPRQRHAREKRNRPQRQPGRRPAIRRRGQENVDGHHHEILREKSG